VANRLFHRDPRFGAGQANACETLDDGAEQRRRGRKIKGDALCLDVSDFAGEAGEIIGRVGRYAAIIDAFGERFCFCGVEEFELFERGHDLRLKGFALER
jgi:hypothetical protein